MGSHSYRFGHVPSAQAAAAYKFHLAASDSHLWLRTNDQIQAMAERGHLFAVWREGEPSEIVGLCYVFSETDDGPRELGGLAVDTSCRKMGLGTLLVQFALAYTIFFEQPWASGIEIIAHVHAENSKPRGVLEGVGFRHSEKIDLNTLELPVEKRPPSSMKLDERGHLVGDTLLLPHESVKPLAEWLSAFYGEFEGGGTRWTARLDFGRVSVDEVRAGLKDIASKS